MDKEILDSYNDWVLKTNYLKRLEKHGSDLFFLMQF